MENETFFLQTLNCVKVANISIRGFCKTERTILTLYGLGIIYQTVSK